MENYKFWEAGGYGLKIFGPKYQKTHPYAKTGRINRLAYVPVALLGVLTLYGAKKKAKTAIGNSSRL